MVIDKGASGVDWRLLRFMKWLYRVRQDLQSMGATRDLVQHLNAQKDVVDEAMNDGIKVEKETGYSKERQQQLEKENQEMKELVRKMEEEQNKTI